MDGEVVLPARGDDRVDFLQRPDTSAGAVVCVLDRDDASGRNVDARPVADLGDDLIG